MRLNSSVFRVLDREVHLNTSHLQQKYILKRLNSCWISVCQVEGSVLIAELICYENDIMQVGHLRSCAEP